MSPLLIKICKDFATIWTTIDPIGNVAIFAGLTRIADAVGTAPHGAARYALCHCHPGRSRRSGTNYSRRHWDSSALAQSGRRTHPVPVRAQNAFWGTGFQTGIARGGARSGGVSAGCAFHRRTGRDDGGDRADG